MPWRSIGNLQQVQADPGAWSAVGQGGGEAPLLRGIKQQLQGEQNREVGEITRKIGVPLVEFGDADVILREQVDRLEAIPADGSEQVVLRSQDSGITGIAWQPEHFRDADRRGDLVRGVLIQEGDHGLMRWGSCL